jgi:hypothetical protein
MVNVVELSIYFDQTLSLIIFIEILIATLVYTRECIAVVYKFQKSKKMLEIKLFN